MNVFYFSCKRLRLHSCLVACEQRRGAKLTPNRHWDPRFRKLREEKFLKVEHLDHSALFDRISKNTQDVSPADVRQYLRLLGLPATRPWKERPPINMTSSGDLMDPYKVPDNEGKVSLLSRERAKGLWDTFITDRRTRGALKRIKKNFDTLFDAEMFATEAHEIFVKAHKALEKREEEELHDYVTERLFPLMWNELQLRSLRWDFVESLEPPKIVHARVFELLLKENMFGQITVRMHSRQILAIYDQFGRLMLGDPKIARDVIEYVVFEKHLSNEYGTWRLHGKVLPEAAPAKTPVTKTFRQEKPKAAEQRGAMPGTADSFERIEPTLHQTEKDVDDSDEKSQSSGQKPQLLT